MLVLHVMMYQQQKRLPEGHHKSGKQVLRWLLIRREFSRVGRREARDMKLAYFGGVVALVENVPQAALSAMFASLVGWTSWTTLNLAASLFLMAWKLATPLLLRQKLL